MSGDNWELVPKSGAKDLNSNANPLGVGPDGPSGSDWDAGAEAGSDADARLTQIGWASCCFRPAP